MDEKASLISENSTYALPLIEPPLRDVLASKQDSTSNHRFLGDPSNKCLLQYKDNPMQSDVLDESRYHGRSHATFVSVIWTSRRESKSFFAIFAASLPVFNSLV